MNESHDEIPNKKEKLLDLKKTKESNPVHHAILNDITLELPNVVSFTKAKHHKRLPIKLNDYKTALKPYWPH